jgi:hypothetical protein
MWCAHSGGGLYNSLLGYDNVYSGRRFPAFRRYILAPSYISSIEMETASSPKTLVRANQTIRCRKLGDIIFHDIFCVLHAVRIQEIGSTEAAFDNFHLRYKCQQSSV